MNQQVERERVVARGLWDDGNCFAIMGAVRQALRRARRGDEFKDYKKQATSGDYDNLVRVTMAWAVEDDE